MLDGISDNMASLVKSGKYRAMETTDKPTIGYYVIKFVWCFHGTILTRFNQ